MEEDCSLDSGIEHVNYTIHRIDKIESVNRVVLYYSYRNAISGSPFAARRAGR